MEKVFLTILNMSLLGAVATAVVLLVRLLLRRCPKIFSYALWIVVLFRLTCPVSFSSEASLIGWLGVPQIGGLEMESREPRNTEGNSQRQKIFSSEHETPTGEKTERPVHEAEASGKGQTISAQSASVSPERSENVTTGNSAAALTGEIVLRVASFIWLAGVAVMLGYCALSFLKFRKCLKRGDISTPFVYGILRPRIYLPDGLSDHEKEYIMLHEQIHIRRGDPIWRMFGFLALCVHWFDPMVWIAFFLSGKDMEMSCDEAVIRRLGKEYIKEYTGSLLNLAVGRHILNGAPLAFGEGDTGSRIRNLLRYKKAAVTAAALAAVLCVASGVVLLADPAKGQEGLLDRVWAKTDAETDTDQTLDTEDMLQEARESLSGQSGTGQEEAAVREAYQELAVEGREYRAYRDGIFCVDGERETEVWKGYLSPDVQLNYVNGKICCVTDIGYDPEREGTTSWQPDGVVWVDPVSGASGECSFADLPYIREFATYPLMSVALGDGFISTEDEGLEEERLECRLPLPSMDMILELGLESAEVESSALEEYGRTLGDYLRENPGSLLDVSFRTMTDTYAMLDLNGDGRLEEIHLCPDLAYVGRFGEGFNQCILTVAGESGTSEISSEADCLVNSLLAFCLDGKEILIAVYEDGPSGDPKTTVYCHEGGILKECGVIYQDIRLSEGQKEDPRGWIKKSDTLDCQIFSDGTICAWERIYDFQTDNVLYTYHMTDDHRLVRQKQEFYELTGKQPYKEAIMLLETLPVSEKPGGKKKLDLTPGQVFFTQIKFGAEGESSWIYVEGYNGAGWMEITDGSHVTALDKENREVFEGLNFAG